MNNNNKNKMMSSDMGSVPDPNTISDRCRIEKPIRPDMQLLQLSTK